MVDNICVAYVMFLSSLQLTAGQLPDTESLRNLTTCDINSAINIACGTDELIVIHSINLAFDVKCVGTCCNTYNSSNCFAAFDADVTREFRRICSGRQTCIAPSIQNTADFCAFSVQDVSYVFLQYYCIPGSRTIAMCATGTITSDGPPLYITSANYPGVTIGSTSCACSIEAKSCSTSITIYEADIDLYLDTTTCQQNVAFKNGTDVILTAFECGSYYTEYITRTSINSHYSKIEFNNNSTANQEGFFLLGLKASVDGVSFTLSCTSVSQSWCVGCGPLKNITNGRAELRVKDDTSYGSIADVSCNNGYETNTPTIGCQENNTWPDAVCTVKAACTTGEWRCTNGDCIADSGRCDNIPDCTDDSDEQKCQSCGPVPGISNGAAVLSANTSIANVICDEGYQESTPTITCQPSRVWEQATCNIVDCGPAPTVQFGNITLDAGTTSFESTATLQCKTDYEPSIPKIWCLSSGQWETSKCKPKPHDDAIALSDNCKNTKDKRRPGRTTGITLRVSTTNASQRKTSMDVILIIIIVVLVIMLVQFSIATFFQCRIHRIRTKASDEDSQMPKRVLMVIAGSVPVLGLIAIYLSGRVFYTDVYKVTHPKKDPGQINMTMNSNNKSRNVSPDRKDLGQINMTMNSNNEFKNVTTDSKSLPVDKRDRPLAAVNGTMTRGISATFDDNTNDMDSYLQRPKLPPIPQHHASDQRHHHFSQEVERQRQQLHDVAEKARRQGKHVQFVREKLYINNCLYQPEHHNHHNEHNTVKFF